MAAPEEKESTSISMVFKDWLIGQSEQFSPVQRINGYPFRLRISRDKRGRRGFGSTWSVSLVCEKSRESELWKCTVKGVLSSSLWNMRINGTYGSWNNEKRICSRIFRSGDTLELEMESVEEDGESWRLRPSVEPFDGALVVGETKRKIGVNKQSLASQSPYFDRLFFGNFKEKNMAEIPIGDVEYKELNNIVKMVYGSTGASLTKNNVRRVLELADRFELKIVEDRVISFLLSSSSFSLPQKLLLAEEKNIPLLKKLCLETNGIREMRNVEISPEFADFSDELKAEIIDRAS